MESWQTSQTLVLILGLSLLATCGIAQTEDSEMKDDETPAMSDVQIRAILETHLVLQRHGMDSVDVRADVAFADEDQDGPRMDVYLPAEREPGDRRPVLLFVHGGPLTPGTLPEPMLRPKDWQFYRDYGRMAAAAGWIGLVPNHRYHSTAEIGQSFSDLESALAWVAGQADELGADLDRVGIWVFSGGGAHIGWAATELSGVRAIAAFYPVASFEAFAGFGMGDTPAEVAERWDPASLLSAEAPPILIGRAGQDTPTLNASIDAFVARAIEVGATVDLLLHPGGVHGFDVRNDVPRSRQVMARAFDFFADAFEDTSASD